MHVKVLSRKIKRIRERRWRGRKGNGTKRSKRIGRDDCEEISRRGRRKFTWRRKRNKRENGEKRVIVSEEKKGKSKKKKNVIQNEKEI